MRRIPLLLIACLPIVAAAQPDRRPPDTARAEFLRQLPVREVTVFKDGHAFVLHEGRVTPDAAGQVTLPYVPQPLVGSFWAYSADPHRKLNAVVAGRTLIAEERAALDYYELLRANLGADVVIDDVTEERFAGKLRAVQHPQPPPEFPEPAPPDQPPPPVAPPAETTAGFQPGAALVLLDTLEGTRCLRVDQIRKLTFRSAPATSVSLSTWREQLALRFDAASAGAAVPAGLVYVQHGLRWIPNYRITIDDRGEAQIELQATLVNDLLDLENVAVHLVIGVPLFKLKETLDPISLQQVTAQLAPQFYGQSRTAYAFSNAIMAQQVRMGDYRGGGDVPAPQTDDIIEGAQNEDLFLFTVTGITLRRGERLVVPVTSYKVRYEDVYALELPLTPPWDVRLRFNTQQQTELARLMAAPKVMHRIRLRNESRYPFTTAPALLLRDGKLLSQSLMTYASPGGSVELDLNTALDIRVTRTERETDRIPNAFTWNDSRFTRVNLAGELKLTNYRKEPVTVDVTRYILGNPDSASADGRVEKTNLLEDSSFLAAGEYPYWWHWYSWPNWWLRFNGVGRITWTVKLQPGQAQELTYTWHYAWD